MLGHSETFQEFFIDPRNQGIVCSSSPKRCRMRTWYASVGLARCSYRVTCITAGAVSAVGSVGPARWAGPVVAWFFNQSDDDPSVACRGSAEAVHVRVLFFFSIGWLTAAPPRAVLPPTTWAGERHSLRRNDARDGLDSDPGEHHWHPNGNNGNRLCPMEVSPLIPCGLCKIRRIGTKMAQIFSDFYSNSETYITHARKNAKNSPFNRNKLRSYWVKSLNGKHDANGCCTRNVGFCAPGTFISRPRIASCHIDFLIYFHHFVRKCLQIRALQRPFSSCPFNGTFLDALSTVKFYSRLCNGSLCHSVASAKTCRRVLCW